MIVLWEELTPGFCFGAAIGAEKTGAEEEEERFNEDDDDDEEEEEKEESFEDMRSSIANAGGLSFSLKGSEGFWSPASSDGKNPSSVSPAGRTKGTWFNEPGVVLVRTFEVFPDAAKACPCSTVSDLDC